MAFDCRSDRRTVCFNWNHSRLEMTMRSLTSVAGGPADPPEGEVRGNRWQSDTSVNVFVRGMSRFLLQSKVLQAPAQPGLIPSVATIANVMAELDWPQAMHSDRRHTVLTHNSVHNQDNKPPPCRTISSDVRSLRYVVPPQARAYIKKEYAAFLRHAAQHAIFLEHTAMRVVVEVNIIEDVVHDGLWELQNSLEDTMGRLPGVYMQEMPAPEPEGFNIVTPAGSKEKTEACAVCLEDVARSWKLVVTKCQHAFHLECISRWLEESTLCPLCRATVREADVTLSLRGLYPTPVPFS